MNQYNAGSLVSIEEILEEDSLGSREEEKVLFKIIEEDEGSRGGVKHVKEKKRRLKL